MKKQREIKFRALVKPMMTTHLPFWIYYKTLEIPTKAPDFNGFIVKDLQFTGLLDRNGDEIFEGDILRIVRDKEKITRSVFWKKSFGGWCLTKCYLGKWDHENNLDQSYADDLKIICNIYEDKKLIK